VLYKP